MSASSKNLDATTDSQPASVVADRLSILEINQNEGAQQAWVDLLPVTEHTAFVKSVDWPSTLVGPMQDWPPALRQATFQVMADSRPATLYWGPHYVPIYNAAFVPLAGQTHPKLMGSTFAQGFPELCAEITPLFELAASTGVAADVHEAPMTVLRNGYPEETFFTGNFTPIRQADGEIVGFYNALMEITKQKIAQRRTDTLNRIASPSYSPPTNVHQHIVACLEENDLDITMAVIYKLSTDTDRTPTRTTLRMKACAGLPENHPLRDDIDWDSKDGLASLCRLSRSRVPENPLMVPVDSIFDDVEWGGSFGPSKFIAVLPLSSGLQLHGFLVVGTNPRLPLGDNVQFVIDLGRSASGAVALAISAGESLLRQERLEKSLANSDKKLWHLLKHASVGMVHFLLDGKLVWGNDEYFRMSGQGQVEGQKEYAFFNSIIEDDLPKIDTAWQRLLAAEEHVTVELRLKQLYTPPIGPAVPATILLLAFPYIEQSRVTSLMACATDISALKWSEAWQARRAQEAREAKRQQEAFIDVVSHEFRNPLSAITLSSESIVSSFEDLPEATDLELPQSFKDILRDNAAAARIIQTCATHQKYIIDSILTLGRLESSMLTFTPTVLTPFDLCKTSLTLSAPDVRFNDIKVRVIEDPSIAELKVTKVCADGSRITQIFINLLTNAIKFTKTRAKREIDLIYGATLSSPRDFFSENVVWPTKGEICDDISSHSEWGEGEKIYLAFTIKDSGIGIEPEEVQRVFERFKQANGKTHSKYGGSGLGLFISKQLSERQGGEIGVDSKIGVGSSFVFYIRVRRVLGNQELSAPIQQTPTSPELLQITPEEVNRRSSVSTTTPATSTSRVLLVEDNLVNQKVLSRHLVKAGFDVTIANHGQEALDELSGTFAWRNNTSSNAPFDIILMDTEMPVLDGLSCTRQIRGLEGEGVLIKRIPIIAVTANAREAQSIMALEAGSDAVMHKPFKSTALIALMKNLIAGSARGVFRGG